MGSLWGLECLICITIKLIYLILAYRHTWHGCVCACVHIYHIVSGISCQSTVRLWAFWQLRNSDVFLHRNVFHCGWSLEESIGLGVCSLPCIRMISMPAALQKPWVQLTHMSSIRVYVWSGPVLAFVKNSWFVCWKTRWLNFNLLIYFMRVWNRKWVLLISISAVGYLSQVRPGPVMLSN